MNKEVKKIFDKYFENVRIKFFEIWELVFEIVFELVLGEVDEIIKWGEFSYSVKIGSFIWIDWKLKLFNNYYLFFNC